MQLKTNIVGLFLISVFIGCGLFESNDNDSASDKVYVPLRGLDQVAIVNAGSDEIDFVDINYSEIGNEPHFVVVDEINRYWFVTTIKSGYVGCYNLDTDELIDTVLVGDAPALMVLNEEDKKLYVSRMMPMETMMMGAVNTIVQEIDYSKPDIMEKKNELLVGSPAPHGLAINFDGTKLYVASNEADWLYKIILATNEIQGTMIDESLGNIDSTEVVQRLKPIQLVSVSDSLLIMTCSAGKKLDCDYNTSECVDVYIPGQVQLWNSNTMSIIDIVQFSWKSRPWHIINSHVNDEVFVTLGGDVIYPGSAGVACLTYASDTLAVKWETYSEDFEGLHGIDVSEDGESLFVSGREDGNLHIFNADSGEKIKSIPLGHNSKPQGVTAVYK